MRETEKFGCPNIDCSYVGFSEGECPECGSQLVKPKGDDYQFSNDFDEEQNEPPINDMDDDPDAVTWYSDGEEKYGAM